MQAKIQVKEIKGFYILDEKGQSYGFTKDSKLSSSSYTAGDSLEINYVKWNDKNYIKSVNVLKKCGPVAQTEPKTSLGEASPLPAEAPVKASVAPTKYGKPLGEYELQQDRRIFVSGLMQAVIQAPLVSASCESREDFVKLVGEITKDLIKEHGSITESLKTEGV